MRRVSAVALALALVASAVASVAGQHPPPSLLANQDTWDGVIATGGTTTSLVEIAEITYVVHDFAAAGNLVVSTG